jgi:hypothetical protein
MRRSLLVASFFCLLSVSWSHFALSVVDISGSWHASTMGAVIEATISQKGHAIDGVAEVHSPFGQKDTYHFIGNIDGNRVTAAHHEGHKFAGSVTPNGQVVGTLRTRDGHEFSVSASRR